MRSLRIGVWIVLLTVFSGRFAEGHAFLPALLSLRELADHRFEVIWRFEAQGAEQARGILRPVFPGHCRQAALDGHPEAGSLVLLLDCGAQGLAGEEITIENLPFQNVEVLVRFSPLGGETETAVLRGANAVYAVPQENGRSRPAWQSYLRLGVEHILFGFDHLLFVLVLMLAVRGLSPLVKTVTAFTLAHSISLAAAVLGWLALPQSLVEALIPLSILVVAADVLRRRDVVGAAPWRSAFAFGLLHGFGFAGALREIGLPTDAIPLALAAFNIGVEVGQLLFVSVLLLLKLLSERVLPGRMGALPIRYVAGYAAGTIAFAWLLERVALF